MAKPSSIRKKLPYYTRNLWYPEKEQMIIEWLPHCEDLEGFLEVYRHCIYAPDVPDSIMDLVWKGLVFRCNSLEDFQTLYYLEDSNKHDEELLKKLDSLCLTASNIDNIIDMFPEESSFYQQLLQKRNKLG